MLIPVFHSLKNRSIKQKSRAPAQHRCEELSTRLHAYTFRQRLGRGAFGQVYLAEATDNTATRLNRKKLGNCLVAVKVIRRAKLEKESTRALACAEAKNLRRISETKSLSFTQLHETFSDAHNLYIVTDFLQGGTLRKEMNRYRRLGKPVPNDRIILIMAQLVEALTQIHGLHIIHRDIKPDNILLDSRGNVVLADFGMSRRFEASAMEDAFEHDADDGRAKGRKVVTCYSRLGIFKSRREKDTKNIASGASASRSEVAEESGMPSITADKSCMTDTGCGTLSYAAPEMHRGEAYSFPVDVYSLGVVFHELLLDRLPPYPPTEAESVYRDDEEWFLDTIRMRTREMTIHTVAFHLLKSLLALDPSKRISIPELRSHSFFSGVHWPTLAAQAYMLPHYHSAPSLPLKLLPYSGIINPGIFVDPLAVLEERPDCALDDAFNVKARLEMKRRPDGKLKQWETFRGGKALLCMHAKTMQAWDFVRRRERRPVPREWALEVCCQQKDAFVKVSELKISPQPESAGDKKEDIGMEVETIGEEKNVSDAYSCASVVASTGHSSSSSEESAPVQRVSPECAHPRRLRRVTARIPSRSRPAPTIRLHIPIPTLDFASEPMGNATSDTDSDSDLCSTIAIFARSFTGSESDLDLNEQPSPINTRPVLARLSTIHFPLSSPQDSASSSPPFPSSLSLSFFLSWAFQHVASSSLPTASSRTEAAAKSRFSTSLLPSSSSCPSLLLSSSLAPSALSSNLPTPVRGNSHLSGVVEIRDGDHNGLKRTDVSSATPGGLSEAVAMHRGVVDGVPFQWDQSVHAGV